MKRVLGYFLILFIISSCTTQKGLKKYYYPFKNLNNSKVYKYVDRNNKKNIEYWKVISIPKRNELKTVSYNSVFKWNGDKTYSYSIKYKNQHGRFDLKKKRTELGLINITINGKEYEALKFKGEYFINAIDQSDSYGFYQFSYYANGIGMIMREMHFPKEVRIMELTEILDEREFEDLKEKASR